MMAFVVPGAGARDVTRAKKLMSDFMRGHGSVPFSPMPRRVGVSVVSGAVRIGVVATIRVRGRVGGGCGILSVCFAGLCWIGGGVWREGWGEWETRWSCYRTRSAYRVGPAEILL